MKRIISHLISNNNSATFENISNEQDITIGQIKHLCSNKSDVFTFEDTILKYNAPFEIYDRTSLKTSMYTYFPKGIKHSCLKLCYEFAASDLNELKYENKVFILPYGKTEDTVIFKPNLNSNILCEVWKLHFDKYIDINGKDMPFPKNTDD